jgi:hypothetical protein
MIVAIWLMVFLDLLVVIVLFKMLEQEASEQALLKQMVALLQQIAGQQTTGKAVKLQWKLGTAQKQ